ncbi:MAG: hypothetical protein KTR18_12630 [Acidiferrobacterales bacterium]|nr:hypothetical protein [Acidiferrobacterales bacterium]
MSQEQLHKLLDQLKEEHAGIEMLEQEYRSKLDAFLESLEQQKLYPEEFDQFSTLESQARELAAGYASQFPKTSALFISIAKTLENLVR